MLWLIVLPAVSLIAGLISALKYETARADNATAELARLKADDTRIVDQVLVTARQELEALEDYYERKLREMP